MPDTNDPTAPVTSHETVVNTQLTTETLDQNGKNIPHNANLDAIFSKIEAGADRKEAVREVMGKKAKAAAAPAPEKKEVVTKTEGAEEKVAKEIKVTSSHPDGEEKAAPSPGLNDALTRTQEKKFDDAEKANEPPPVADDEPIADDQLQVLQTDKPKTAKRISALLKKVTEVTEREALTVKEKLAKEEEIKTLKEQLANVKTADPKTEEEIVQARKELSMFRRKYELDKDPEIKQRFDSRIESADSAIPDILKKNNAGEGLINLIKEEGGWAKFSNSNRLVTLADGSKVTTAELADQIVQALPFSDRKAVDSLTTEQITVKREKERFLEAEIKQADEFFRQREEAAQRGSSEYAKQIKEAEATIKKWQEKVAVENAFLKEKEIPSDATPEQKKELEEENAHAKELNNALKKNLNTKDLDGMLNIVLEATKFHQEKRQRAKLEAENAKLKADLKAKADELDRFKESGKTTLKPGSLKGGGSAPVNTKVAKPQTLEDAFDKLAAARGSSDE
jgi:hypothetical protein